MDIKKKKILAVAGIALIGISAFAYYQYKKLMDFALSFKGVKVNKLSASNINLDVFFKFENKSSLGIVLHNQKYDVYLNDVYITTLRNDLTNKISPKSVSVVGVNVNITDTKALGNALKNTNLLASVLNLGGIKVKIVERISMTVGGFIPYTLNYTYESTIKEMMA